MRLQDKVVFVTGGSQGIGEAIACRFGREGGRIAVLASVDRAKAGRVAERIRRAGGTAEAFAADVAAPALVADVVAQVAARLGPIDILVNSAGVFYATPAGETEAASYHRMVDTNLNGTWNTINAIAPGMKTRRSGKIINIASVAGVMGIGGHAAYCATKAAVIMMTRALACELAPFGINVNCIAPGNTETPMNVAIRTKPELKPFLDAMAARTPSGRTYSAPDDVAGAALFLASDDGRAMHGACMLIDEGFSAGL